MLQSNYSLLRLLESKNSAMPTDALVLCQSHLGAGWYHCNPTKGQRGDHGITPRRDRETREREWGRRGADRL